MPISRRNFFRKLGVSTVASTVLGPVAGIPLSAASPRHAGRGPILLSRNENPYGPSDSVHAALRESTSLANRYPSFEYGALAARIATLHGVATEQIVLGCGSSAIMRAAIALFVEPDKKLVLASPTFAEIGNFAQLSGIELLEVPINKKYEHDLPAMLSRAGTSAGLVYICNPNNPTGTLTPRKDIESFVRKLPDRTMVLIDEAYHHFVSPNGDYASFLDHPFDDPRVMVVRSFSKIYGLAGMRVGYLVGSPNVAARFSPQQLESGVTSISARAALAALGDSEYVHLASKRNADDRQDFMNRLNGYMLRSLDSHTNFVMLNPMRRPEEVIAHLKRNDILIGPTIPAMPNYIRVSLGTPEEMQEFWNSWSLMPAINKMAM